MEQAILQVSLKEYKKSIDDLRASLLSLDSTSEEYKTTVDEIRDRQQKLNEVMSVGKKDVDAVAGSYNALQQQMAALKKEWKSMEIGTEEWKAMAAQINSLNDQLKDADALTGNFQRNVGDYANAFSTAFDKAAGELGKIPGPLGQVFHTVKLLIPVIKQANTTATTGLAGVKKALVSTGIGALVVAVGLLVSHWGDLMKLFKRGKSAAESAAEANDKLNAEFEEQNFQLEQETSIMEAQGAATEDIIAKKTILIKKQIEAKKASLEEAKAALKAVSAHSWLGRVLRGEQADYKALAEQIKEQEAELEKLSQAETKLGTDAQVAAEKRKRAAEEAYRKEREEADKLIRQIEENNKDEIQKLTEKYQREYNLLKKHHRDTKALTEQYNKDMAALVEKGEKEAIEAARRVQEEAVRQGTLGGRTSTAIGGSYSKILQDIQTAQNRVNAIQATGQFSGETEVEYTERLAGAIEDLVAAKKAEAQWRANNNDVISRYIALSKGQSVTPEQEIDNITKEIEDYYEVLKTYFPLINSADGRNIFHSIPFEEGTQEWKDMIWDMLVVFPEDARSHFLELWEQFYAKKKEMDDKAAEDQRLATEKMRADMLDLAGSVADVSGSISQIIETSLETRKKQMLEEGKTEEEANAILEKKFKTVQAFQAAEAVVSTLAGATQAFAGIMGSTGGWGTAAAIAKFIAVLTTGAAQVQKIYATNPYENNSASLSSSVSVSPQLGDYTPQSTANLTSASDQDNLVNALQSANISVSVTDINRVQNRVRVRENEARW